jgi:hypothetical protein
MAKAVAAPCWPMSSAYAAVRLNARGISQLLLIDDDRAHPAADAPLL